MFSLFPSVLIWSLCNRANLTVHRIHSIMAFCCIKFIRTNEVEAVPASWLIGNICKWPPFKEAHKIARAIKDTAKPETNWSEHEVKIYKTFGKSFKVLNIESVVNFYNLTNHHFIISITILLLLSGNFEDARKASQVAELTSDVQSDSNHELGRGFRK